MHYYAIRVKSPVGKPQTGDHVETINRKILFSILLSCAMLVSYTAVVQAGSANLTNTTGVPQLNASNALITKSTGSNSNGTIVAIIILVVLIILIVIVILLMRRSSNGHSGGRRRRGGRIGRTDNLDYLIND